MPCPSFNWLKESRGLENESDTDEGLRKEGLCLVFFGGPVLGWLVNQSNTSEPAVWPGRLCPLQDPTRYSLPKL